MKSHTFGVGRPTFKHTFITDGRGITWLAQVAEKNGTLSYLGAARGCWLLAEDHLGEHFSPIYITHRLWVTDLRGEMTLDVMIVLVTLIISLGLLR